MDGGFVPADWPPSREWKSTLAGNKNAKTFFIFCVELKRGKKFKVYPTTNQLKTMWIFLNFNVIRRCEFFFFFFFIYAVISLDTFPVFFHFPSSKIQRERRRYTRLCGESWVKFDADKSSDCFLFFFHFGQFLFSRYSRTPPPWNEKKKKKSQKKEQKKKTSWAAVSLSLSLFFFSFLNTENIIQVYVLSYYV